MGWDYWRGYAPAKDSYNKISFDAQFHDPTQPDLTTPPSRLGKRIRYQIKEYEPTWFSEQGVWGLDTNSWGYSKGVSQLWCFHRSTWYRYDGLCNLALSFMLVNLAKPVIVTGSLTSLRVRNDAVEHAWCACSCRFVQHSGSLFVLGQFTAEIECGKVDASALMLLTWHFSPLLTLVLIYRFTGDGLLAAKNRWESPRLQRERCSTSLISWYADVARKRIETSN